MELLTAHVILTIFIGVCAFFAGMLIGVAIGYFAGRHERKRNRPKWDWDKLKRSDHFHHERKRTKDAK